jgi:cytochrome c biogenesis protein CcdA
VNLIISLSEWARITLEQAGTSPFALSLAFLLGLSSAVASTCCTLPVFGAIVGYAGTRESISKRSNLLDAGFFMLGTTVALIILGGVAGLIGQVAQTILGQYWKIFAGIIAVVVGLGTLNLLPFTIPQKKSGTLNASRRGLLGTAIVGLVIGGAVSVCSLACNPGFFIILGVAVLQGYTFWMFGILVAYAVGFSLPLAALMAGVSWGKSAIRFKKADRVIRIAAGVVLIGIGFYFFMTF